MAQREINCQGVSARMMELLYGELSSEDRATLEAHLAGCASCRAELSSFQSTRVSARRALDADEPSARAHQAILRAAAAAVGARQLKPVEARAAAPRPSFWQRWRVRWTLPTFATVGAVAVVLLASKVFLEPEKTVELGRQAARSAPTEAPAAPPRAAEPAGAVATEARAEKVHPAPAEKKRRREAPEQPQPSVANNAPARSSAAPATAPRRRVAPDDLDELGGQPKGGGAASAGRAKAEVSDDNSFGDESVAAPPGRTKSARRQFTAPPPPLAEPARPVAPAAKQAELEALDEAVPAPRGSVGHLAGSAGAAPPPSRAKAKKVDQPSEMPSRPDNLDRGPAAAAAPAPARAPAAAPAAADKSDARAEGSAESKPVESPVAHADRLFAQGQWAAAARAYRELLHRDPSNGDAARWRQRLAASERAASAQAPAAAPAASPGRR